MAKNCFQSALDQDLAQRSFPNCPRRGFWLPAQRPSNCRNLLPKGSRPGFGPKRPFPNCLRTGFWLPAQRPSSGRNLLSKRSRPGFGPTVVSQLFQKGILIASPKALKLPNLASKGLPARIWPKTAVSQLSHKGILVAGPRALKLPKFAFKGLSTRIWPKTVVSQLFQKGILIASPKALECQKFASKRLPAKIWPKNLFFCLRAFLLWYRGWKAALPTFGSTPLPNHGGQPPLRGGDAAGMPQVPAPAWSTKSTTSTKSSKSTTFAMFPRLLFHDRRLPPNPSPTLLPHNRGPTTTRRYKISFTPHGQGLPPKKRPRRHPLAWKVAPDFCPTTGGCHQIRPGRSPWPARRPRASAPWPGVATKSVPHGSPWPDDTKQVFSHPTGRGYNQKASPTAPLGLGGGPRLLPHDRGLPPNPSSTLPRIERHELITEIWKVFEEDICKQKTCQVAFSIEKNKGKSYPEAFRRN